MRSTFLLAAALVFVADQSAAKIYQYFGLSDNPEAQWPDEGNVSEPFVGERTLYLLMFPAAPQFTTGEIELKLETTFEVVDLIPQQGLENHGTLTEPVLSGSDCVVGVLAHVIVRDPLGAGGTVCLAELPSTERLCFRCGEQWYLVSWFGYSTDGSFCEGNANSSDCLPPVPVVGNTWGRIKSSYRH